MNTYKTLIGKGINLMALVLILCSMLLIFSCAKEKETKHNYPRVVTGLVTNINAGGATFNGSFQSAGTEEVIDHGFVFGTTSFLDNKNNEKISLGPSSGSGSFSAIVNSGMVRGETYSVSAYAQSKEKIFYAEPVYFVSKGGLSPEIYEVVPGEGIAGDTVTIKGKYFGNSPRSNNVAFNDKPAVIISASDTEIIVMAPASGGKEFADIFVATAGQTAQKISGFRYLKPELTDLSPRQGVIGDTITITGKYFLSDIEIRFNQVRARVYQSDLTSVRVIVPACGSAQANITAIVDGFTSVSEQTFIYAKAEITGLSADKGVIGDTIVIEGKNFGYLKEAVSVFVGEQAITILGFNNSSIRIIVPASGGKTPLAVTVKINGQLVDGYQMFTYLAPGIDSFEPSSGKAGTMITITGKNFSKIKKQNLVMVDQMTFRVVEANNNRLKVIIPDTTYAIISSMSIKVDEKETLSTNKFEVISPWTRKKDYSGDVVHRAFGFTVSGNAYFAGGTRDGSLNDKVWQYLPETDQWIPKKEGNYRISRSDYAGFEVDEKYYFVNPYHNMVEYNPLTDIWTDKRSYTDSRYSIQAFAIDNKGYTIRYNRGGINRYETWVYDQDNDQWELINVKGDFSDEYNYCFTIGNKSYVGLDQKLLEFTPETNEWKDKTTLPANMQFRQHGYAVFPMFNKGYFIDVYSNGNYYHPYHDIWEYDPSNNQCKIVSHYPGEMGRLSFYFVVNNKAYIGYNINDEYPNYTKHFWEFDPSKL